MVHSSYQSNSTDMITEDIEYFKHFQINPNVKLEDQQLIDLMRQTLHDLDN